MKIETTITPRRDGSVRAVVDGQAYVFVADDSGALVCEVQNEKHIGYMLLLGDFLPAEEADCDMAGAIMASHNDLGEDSDDDVLDDEPDMNAVPIEEPASAAAEAPKNKGGRPRKAH